MLVWANLIPCSIIKFGDKKNSGEAVLSHGSAGVGFQAFTSCRKVSSVPSRSKANWCRVSSAKATTALAVYSAPPPRSTAKRPVRNPPADREKSATFFLRYFFHIPFAFHQHHAVPFYRRIIGLFFINHWIISTWHAKLRATQGNVTES